LRGRQRLWRIVLACVVPIGLRAQDRGVDRYVSFLAFGDVNVGRTVGQKLFEGDVEYPFELVRDTLSRADVVFVNLESQLTDQSGETQHPRFNLIFCGPPEGAIALREANISVVSTANNHAYDYGLKGLHETIESLRAVGITWTGTSQDSVDLIPPAVVVVDGVKIGFVGYTHFVNLKGSWQGRIAVFDERKVRQALTELRGTVDFIVASYHGGAEYVERPPARIRQHMRILIDAGADVVIGHHPHYVQGIEEYRGKLIFYSLGNFVFHQPQREWAQKGIGVELKLARRAKGVSLEQVRLLPVRAGLQPSFSLTVAETRALFERVRKLSNVNLQEADGRWYVRCDEKKSGD